MQCVQTKCSGWKVFPKADTIWNIRSNEDFELSANAFKISKLQSVLEICFLLLSYGGCITCPKIGFSHVWHLPLDVIFNSSFSIFSNKVSHLPSTVVFTGISVAGNPPSLMRKEFNEAIRSSSSCVPDETLPKLVPEKIKMISYHNFSLIEALWFKFQTIPDSWIQNNKELKRSKPDRFDPFEIKEAWRIGGGGGGFNLSGDDDDLHFPPRPFNSHLQIWTILIDHYWESIVSDHYHKNNESDEWNLMIIRCQIN